jgi:hypothetical protein
MRLILQDGDSKRALRLKDGTFSIGSGEGCKITLASSDVAEHHADLVVEGDSVSLEVLSAEHPVLLGGKAIDGRAPVKSGQLFSIGEARFKLDASPKAKAAAKAPAAQSSGARASGARASGASKRGAAASPGVERPQRVERSSRRPQGQSFPTWLILVLAVPAVLLAYKMFGTVATSSTIDGFSEKTSRIRIEESLDMSDADAALKELAWVYEHSDSLTPEWRKVFDALKEKANDMGEETLSLANEVDGTNYVEKRLKKFKGRYLLTNTRPEAREFIRRADRFLEEYPVHPERDWVLRQRDHFARYAMPDEPATLEDLMVEIKFLTEGKPRDFITARARIAEFQVRTNEGEDELQTKLTELTDMEKEYYEEHLDVAAGLWERENYQLALSKLMMLLSGLSNPAYSDDCARRITEMPGVLNALQGYKRDQAFFLKQCSDANANFAAFLKKNGL